jgi:drug/metabolite transporter (DMT)-like permease
MTGLAVTTSLDARDIPALRFGAAGMLLLPIAVRRGPPWMARIGRDGRTICACGGLRVALCRAYEAGALNPGCMPLYVALIGAIVLGEKPSKAKKLPLSLILCGAVVIVR